MTIKLTDAAKYYKELPHQLAAWNWLQEQLTKEQLDEFADLYRSAVDPKPTYQNTWNGIRQAASDAGAKFPEVVAAQWALESGWGKHVSGKHNYFGLKGKGGTVVDTQEYIDGQWVTIKDGFINFPDLYSCVQYLVNRWYKDFDGYQGVNRAANRNECAKLLVKENYATDPDYADKLMQIMDRECTANPPGGKVLNVPYFYQLDNQSGYGYRECFSSSCAMIAAYYGLVDTDDEYNKIRAKFGDSTESTAQVKALQYLGLTAWFGTKGNTELLENQIKECHPIAVGWLHYGSASAPKGGGHWTCCIGFDKDHIIMNDPYGEADLINGGYVSTEAKRGVKVKYSRKNWLRRWEVEGKSTGWYLAVKPCK
jgi:hypothetical protein